MNRTFWPFIFLLCLTACRTEPLKKLDKATLTTEPILRQYQSKVQVDVCSLDPEDVKLDLKLTLIVDQSGSNRQGDDGSPGTDPIGNRRFGPLEEFATTVIDSDPEISLALLTFNTNILHSTAFSKDHKAFASQVRQIWHQDTSSNPAVPKDSGYTDFAATITTLRNNIRANITESCQPGFKRQVVYAAMLVSDGFPYLNIDQPQAETTILTAVDDLIAIPTAYKNCVNKIILYTGFYFNPGPNDLALNSEFSKAKTLMQAMASHGGGTYHEFPQNIDFGAFVVPERKVKYAIRDIIARNVNTVWSANTLRYDTDADGLADLQETELGSDKTKADSDLNGVSDFVEYKVFGRPCRDQGCSQSNSNLLHINLCKKTRFSESSNNGAISFPDTDHDGLNDCEEKLLNSRADLFSTNLSWMPDSLLLANGMNLLGDPKEMTLDLDWDGLSNYGEIKWGTPLLTQNAQIPALIQPKYTLTRKSDGSAKECYHVDIIDIATLTPSDMIRVFVMDGSLAVDVKRILRSSERRLNNHTATFTASDFIFIQ